MCGRFIATTREKYRAPLTLVTPAPESNFRPNYNVAPAHDVLVCAAQTGPQRLVGFGVRVSFPIGIGAD